MRKIRVLVADDNEVIREIVVSALAAEFDVVRAVTDGGSAVAAAVQLLPDIAVLDISMPVLNGIEVARRMRETCESIKVVFLTADTDLGTFDAALGAGSLGYVLKPRLATDLVRAIRLASNGGRFVSPGVQ